MALIGLIDIDEPLDARADAVLRRALHEAAVHRTVGASEAAELDRGDRILLIGANTLLDSTLIEAMAESDTATLACLPNEPKTTHHELIDATTRWAGWAMLPGDVVAETAQGIAPEWSLASTLVRRAVQQGALRIDASRTGALIALDAPDAVMVIDVARLRAAMRPRSGIAGRLVERAALFLGERLLGVEHKLRWAASAALLLVTGYAGALAYGFLAFAAGALLLLIIALRVVRGLAAVDGSPLPWIERVADLLGLVGLAGATSWLWHASGQWGVFPLAIVLAADTVMAVEDESDAALPLWWRADVPSYAAIMLVGALAGQPVAALVAATAYASASFAATRRRLRAQRLSSET